jgi:ClpP class serine protease
MSLYDVFWVLLILSVMQPALRQRLLEHARQRLIERCERERKSRVILLVHRLETMNLLGFPLVRYIDVHDSEAVIRAIELTDDDVPLDIVLHTPGGLALAAVQIARAIHRHPARVTVFVPHMAMSGGTLIALAADEIVMSPNAVLGPVDPQIGQYPAGSLLATVARKPVEYLEDQTLILADQAERAIRQLRSIVLRLLGDDLDPARAESLAELLTQGTWTHDFPLGFDDAQQLGLPVSDQMPRTVMSMMSLYPQPVRQGVEYLPGRRSTRD